MNEKTFINPYIEKVQNHEKIINIEDKAFQHKGNWSWFFQNTNDIILEIWTGLWNFFSNEVAKNKNKNFIGLEIKFKRIFVSAEKTLKKWWKKFVLIKTNWKNIDKLFWENEISLTYIFFPDPWDKKDYQRKNRLIDKDFLDKLYFVTKKWASLIFKTDHKEYFDSVLDIIERDKKWIISKKSYDYENELSNFDKTNLTEFESIFREHKLNINYLEIKK